MDAQKLMDVLNQSTRLVRSQYHLTLGKLIETLNMVDPNLNVCFDFDSELGPGREHSYRGYYSDLAFETQEHPTVKDLLEQCKKALDNNYGGYKGGDFVMDKDTPLWVAEYGDTGLAIVEVYIAPFNVILKTKEIEC